MENINITNGQLEHLKCAYKDAKADLKKHRRDNDLDDYTKGFDQGFYNALEYVIQSLKIKL